METITNLPKGLVTVMFTDIVDSSLLKGKMPGETSRRRDQAFRESIKVPHDEIVKVRVTSHQGQLINPTGDGFCFAFDDAEEAVLCALEIQKALSAQPISTPLGPLRVRIGLHTGIADPTGSDYIASTVDKAARVQSKAEGSQVVLSRECHALVRSKIKDVDYAPLGDFDLKGLGKEELFLAFFTGANPLAEAENRYRQHLINYYGKLTLYSVTSDAPLAVDLERVFVKLTATQRQIRQFIDKEGKTWIEMPVWVPRIGGGGCLETNGGTFRRRRM